MAKATAKKVKKLYKELIEAHNEFVRHEDFRGLLPAFQAIDMIVEQIDTIQLHNYELIQLANDVYIKQQFKNTKLKFKTVYDIHRYADDITDSFYY